jgi:glycogen operon protein
MITMGDEVGRTQNGSNNAYSLPMDGDISSEKAYKGGWALNWKPSVEQADILETVSTLNSLRKKYLSDVMKEFFTGELDLGTSRKDLAWFRRNGEEMNSESWHEGDRNYLSMVVDATANQALLMIFNGSREAQEFTLPDEKWGSTFRTVFDSSFENSLFEPKIAKPADVTTVAAHAVQVWLVNRA